MDKTIERLTDSQRRSLKALARQLRATADRIDRIELAASTPEELVKLSGTFIVEHLSPLELAIRDVDMQDSTLYQFLLAAERV